MDIQNFTSPEVNIKNLGVHEGMTIVDLGAGVGAYTLPLARMVGESGKVIAVEVQKEFLTNIKNAAEVQGHKNIEVIWGDIERIGGTKVKNAIADAVIISNVLFQAEDKGGLLREARRILKPGGKALLIDWKDSFNNLGPTKDAVIPEQIARELCVREGFVIKSDFNAGEHHYGIVMTAFF